MVMRKMMKNGDRHEIARLVGTRITGADLSEARMKD